MAWASKHPFAKKLHNSRLAKSADVAGFPAQQGPLNHLRVALEIVAMMGWRDGSQGSGDTRGSPRHAGERAGTGGAPEVLAHGEGALI